MLSPTSKPKEAKSGLGNFATVIKNTQWTQRKKLFLSFRQTSHENLFIYSSDKTKFQSVGEIKVFLEVAEVFQLICELFMNYFREMIQI